MSLGVNRYRRALPLQNVSHGLFLIPRARQALAGAQQHGSSSTSSSTRCLVRPSLLTRCFATTLRTAAKIPRHVRLNEFARQKKFSDKLASILVRPHEPRESILVKPPTVYPTARATFAEENKRYLAIRRQQWLAEGFAKHNPQGATTTANWRHILRLLSDYTPSCSPGGISKTIKIDIPSQSRDLIAHERITVFQTIADRAGCEIDIHEAEDPQQDTNYFLISGPPDCVEAAADEIKKLDGRVTVRPYDPDQSQESEKSSNEFVRVTDDHYRPFSSLFGNHPYSLWVRADEIPRPSEWNQGDLQKGREMFESYVDKLVLSRMGPGVASKLYPEHGSHELAVTRILLEVFADPSLFSFITPRAFKMALAYMACMTHNTSSAKRLLQSVYGRGFDVDLGGMHMLLEGAVNDKNLADFQVLIEQLVRQGFKPTLWTWILFLRPIRAEDLKRYILYLMDEKGLLDLPGAMRLVALEMAEHDAYRAARLGMDSQAFIARQTDLYGPHWIYTDTCNKILHELLLHDRVDIAFSVLMRMAEGKRVKGDHVTLNTILTHSLRKRDELIAIRALEFFYVSRWSHTEDGRSRHVLKDETYDLLMKIAFKNRRPYMLSVVWRCANIHKGKTTFWMRSLAYQLVQGNERAMSVLTWASRGQKFSESAKKVLDLLKRWTVPGEVADQSPAKPEASAKEAERSEGVHATEETVGVASDQQADAVTDGAAILVPDEELRHWDALASGAGDHAPTLRQAPAHSMASEEAASTAIASKSAAATPHGQVDAASIQSDQDLEAWGPPVSNAGDQAPSLRQALADEVAAEEEDAITVEQADAIGGITVDAGGGGDQPAPATKRLHAVAVSLVLGNGEHQRLYRDPMPADPYSPEGAEQALTAMIAFHRAENSIYSTHPLYQLLRAAFKRDMQLLRDVAEGRAPFAGPVRPLRILLTDAAVGDKKKKSCSWEQRGSHGRRKGGSKGGGG